jgi:hypothetical protein
MLSMGSLRDLVQKAAAFFGVRVIRSAFACFGSFFCLAEISMGAPTRLGNRHAPSSRAGAPSPATYDPALEPAPLQPSPEQLALVGQRDLVCRLPGGKHWVVAEHRISGIRPVVAWVRDVAVGWACGVRHRCVA